jgi:hypothetical protein
MFGGWFIGLDVIPARRSHAQVGSGLARSAERSAVVLGPREGHSLDVGPVDGELADIVVGRFYGPQLDEGCAFAELTSFQGGIGGPTDATVHPEPVTVPRPQEPIVGAAYIHEVLWGWRRALHGDGAGARDAAEPVEPARDSTAAANTVGRA